MPTIAVENFMEMLGVHKNEELRFALAAEAFMTLCADFPPNAENAQRLGEWFKRTHALPTVENFKKAYSQLLKADEIVFNDIATYNTWPPERQKAYLQKFGIPHPDANGRMTEWSYDFPPSMLAPKPLIDPLDPHVQHAKRMQGTARGSHRPMTEQELSDSFGGRSLKGYVPTAREKAMWDSRQLREWQDANPELADMKR